MNEIVLSLPLPPSLNMIYRGNRYKTLMYKYWCRDTDLEVKTQKLSKISGPVAVKICIERRRGSDLDNRIKACLDVLVRAGVIDDDRHVEEILVRWDDEVCGAEVRVRAA